MTILLIIIHVVVCVALIMIVLLQTGKGADMGAAFGGGSSNTLFGSTGATTFLGKMTTAAAVIFMLTSLVLAYVSGNRQAESLMKNAPIEQPAQAPQDGGGVAPAQPDQPNQPNPSAGDEAPSQG